MFQIYSSALNLPQILEKLRSTLIKKIYNKPIKSFQVTKTIREISNEKPTIWVFSLMETELKGLLLELFYQQHEDVTAVQGRNRKQVKDTQLQTYERHQEKQLCNSAACCITNYHSNFYWTAKVIH